jgi:hypothetical protein
LSKRFAGVGLDWSLHYLVIFTLLLSLVISAEIVEFLKAGIPLANQIN